MRNDIDLVLNRSIAGPYYRQHAGFFLFIFFLLFGTQPSLYQALQFHEAIIEGILTNTSFFLMALTLWTLYAAKIIQFMQSNTQKKAFQFLGSLQVISKRKRIYHLLRLQTNLFAPVWVYSLFIFWIAIKGQYVKGAVGVIVVLVLLSTASVLLFDFLLRRGSTFAVSRIKYPFRLPGGLFSFLLRFIFREQFIVLLVVKTVSFFCLYGLAKLETRVYEDRLLWLIYLTVLIGHSIIIYRNHHFIESKLYFFRNLPLKKLHLFLSLLVIYVVILLPEIWALKGVAIIQQESGNYLWMILSGPCILLLLHCLLYTEDMKMEAYMQLVFGAWIVLVFFSLSENKWLIPIICGLMALFIFFSSYYSYEKKAATEKLE